MIIGEPGYYWAYRKGSPVPDIVYVYEGYAYEVVIIKNTFPVGSPSYVDLDGEALSEGKWILGEKILPPGVDNLP